MALGGIRSHAEFKSDQGVQYRLRIYDSEQVSDLNYELNVGAEGFVLTYDGRGKKRYEFIKGSRVDFELNVPNAAHPIQSMINDLPTSEQGRWKLSIEASDDDGVTYDPFWYGVITSDVVDRKDISYPYFVNLTAVDGLSLLRDVPFNKEVYDGVTGSPTTLYSFVNVIINMLKYYNPTSDFFTTGDNFLYEHVHWYEDSMPHAAADVSPLENAAIYPNAFMGFELNDDNEILSTNPITAYECLEQLMKTWGCKIFQSNGYWFMCHSEMYANLDTINYYRRWDIGFTKLGYGTSSAADYRVDMGAATDGQPIVKLSNGIYSFLPKLFEVRARYSNWTTSGLYGELIDPLPNWPGTSTATGLLNDLGYVVAASGSGINITHRIQYKLESGASSGVYDVLAVKYMLKVGSYYYNGSTWTTTASSFSTPSLFIEPYVTTEYQDFGGYPQFSHQTPDFPASGNVYFQAFKYESAWAYNNFADDYDMRILGNTASYPSFVQLTVNGALNAERTFSSSNSSTIANSVEDLGEVLCGDGPTTTAPSWGRIRIYDGASWLNTVEENWQAWETGTESRITTILCEQILSGQNEFTPLNQYNLVLTGTTAKTFSPAKCIRDTTNGNDLMVTNGYKFIANFDEIQGEFWKATSDFTDLTNTQNTITQGVIDTPNDLF